VRYRSGAPYRSSGAILEEKEKKKKAQHGENRCMCSLVGASGAKRSRGGKGGSASGLCVVETLEERDDKRLR